jgi:SulP family sulfate permease
VTRHPDYEPVPGLLILRLESPLAYVNATPIRDRIKQIVGSSDPTPRFVVLDAGANDALDITSAEMLDQLATTLSSAGVTLVFADIRLPVIEMARRTGLLEDVGPDRVFHTIDEAVHALSGPEGEPRSEQPVAVDGERGGRPVGR